MEVKRKFNNFLIDYRSGRWYTQGKLRRKKMVIEWLFKKAGGDWKPQLGWADETKRALLWLPGNKAAPGVERIQQVIQESAYSGCTQCAFQSWTRVQIGQRCLVCWVGIDVDEEPIDDDKLVAYLRSFHASLRSSRSGFGRHILVRLDTPVECAYEHAGSVVRTLAEPIAESVRESGHKVCKADRRMFWLTGGEQQWLFRDEQFWDNPELIDLGSPVDAPPVPVGPVGSGVESWLRLFRERGLVRRDCGVHNAVYVGDFVATLRSAGQTVHTRSTCRGNGQVNGYLDVRPGYIGLWSYADGHVIWCYQDEMALGL
jgi:hypothetical protein